MKIKTALFALSVWMAIPVAAQAATYYLDDDGVNSLICDAAVSCGVTACRNWDYLVEQSGATLTAGDTIILCNTEGAWVSLGSTATVDCGIDLNGVDNITFQGETGVASDVKLLMGDNQTACRAFTAGGSDPRSAFRIMNSTGSTVRDVTINATIAASSASGILYRDTTGGLIQNVVIESAEREGIECGNGGVGTGGANPATSLVIRDVVVKQATTVSGAGGIGAFKCPLLEVHDTVLDGSTSPAIGDRDGIHITNSHGYLIDGLISHGWSEEGFDGSRTGSSDNLCESWNAGGCVGGSEVGTACAADADCAGGGTCRRWVIANSKIYDNQTSGTGSALAVKSCNYHGLIYNNFLKDSGDAIRLNKCAHALQIFNNTMFGGFQVWQNHYDLDVRNNIMVRSGAIMQVGKTSVGLEVGDENVFDYNLVYTRAGGDVISGIAGGSVALPPESQQCGGPGDVGAGTICCDTQAGLPSASSYSNTQGALFASDNEFGGVGANNVFNTDISWVNQAATPPDLHISAGSPALDIGVTLTSFAIDIDADARPQGASWDLGADELAGTLPACGLATAPTCAGTCAPLLVCQDVLGVCECHEEGFPGGEGGVSAIWNGISGKGYSLP